MNKRLALVVFFLGALFVGPLPAFSEVAQIEPIYSQDKYLPGTASPIAFRIKISKSWYLHGQTNNNHEFLLPTKLSFTPLEGIKIANIKFPNPELRKFDYSAEKIEVFSGEIIVKAKLKIDGHIPPGKYEIKGLLDYQACTSGSCAPPEKVPFVVTVNVAGKGHEIVYLNQDIFSSSVSVAGLKSSSQQASKFDTALWLSLLLVFVGGLALNLTPCVYPLIPITISFFGGRSKALAGKRLFHAAIYICGLSVTNSLLGVMAAITGGMLGSILQNPYVLMGVAAILLFLGLSFFGLWELQVPTGLMNMASRNFGGFLGTFFMGLTLGIVAAPCVGPFILGLLSYVGQKGDPFLGFLYFFVLSLGLGLPLAVLAIFSGSLEKLPMSGDWMVWIRKCLGWVLIGMAGYMINPLITSPMAKGVLFSVILIAAGLHIGWLDRSGQGLKKFSATKKIIGTALILLACFSFYGEVQKRQGIEWIPHTDEALLAAKENNRPVIIDFYADWCKPCREMEETTFADPEILALSKHFVMLRVDLTRKFKGQNQILRKYGVRGVPTLVFLDKTGKERGELKIESYAGKKKLLDTMKALVLGNNSS